MLRHVVLPHLRPAILAASSLVFMLALAFYVTPLLIGGPTQLTIATLIDREFSQRFDLGSAATMGLVLLAIVLAIYASSTASSAWSRAGRTGADGRPARSALALRSALGGTGSRCALAALHRAVPADADPDHLPDLAHGDFFLRGRRDLFSLRWFEAFFDNPVWTDALWKSIRIAVPVAIIATASGRSPRSGSPTHGAGGALLQTLFIAPMVLPIITYALGLYDVAQRFDLTGSIVAGDRRPGDARDAARVHRRQRRARRPRPRSCRAPRQASARRRTSCCGGSSCRCWSCRSSPRR